MKIGIMGGTFDPIHNGHLMLGEYAYREFKLDQVWFMPNGNPPHKQDSVFQTTREDRMEMVTRSIEKYDYFRLEDYEIKRQEISYSYQTMEYFKEKYPENHFYFIIGADSLFMFEQWVHPERIAAKYRIHSTCELFKYALFCSVPVSFIYNNQTGDRTACWYRLLQYQHLPVLSRIPVSFRNYWKNANPFSESRLRITSIFSIFGPSTYIPSSFSTVYGRSRKSVHPRNAPAQIRSVPSRSLFESDT